MRKATLVLALAAITLIAGVAQAQSLPAMQWATGYNQWVIQGQAPNTYTFTSPSICRIANLYNSRTYTFSTNAPVLINDLGTPSNSEVVTPGTVTNNPCGFTATTTHTHSSFNLQSGTAGLQEAINNSTGGSTTNQSEVVLSPGWWTQANALPGTNGAAVIAAAAGSAKINLVDITTVPYTWYSWNGAAYVKTGMSGATSYGGLVTPQFQGYKNTSLTALAPPTAGAFGVSAPTGIAAATYRVAQTCVDPLGGETLISTDSSSTVTTTSPLGSITAAAPTCPAGSVGWELYISAASGGAGSELFYAPGTTAGCTLSTQGVKPSCALTSGSVTSALVTSTAKVPDQATAYLMAIVGQDTAPTPYLKSWPPFAVTGVQTFTTAYTLAQFKIPAGYMNQLGKTLQVCGNYNVTPSATGTDAVTVLGINAFNQSPNTLITWTSGALTNAAYEAPFCFTMTTAAVGASGTVEVHGQMRFALASTGVEPARGYSDANTATVAIGDLTKEITISMQSTPGTSNVTQGQMRQFVVTPLN